jgi:hypothetical protein
VSYLYVPHECNLPYPHTDGTIWRCECGKVWRASCPGNPNYAGWRRLGPIGRWLYGVNRKEWA